MITSLDRAKVSPVAMSKVVNLNKFRTLKAKQEASKRAAANRRANGRTKAERARDELEQRKLKSKVDGAHLEEAPEAPDES
jgi:hypothetical protein